MIFLKNISYDDLFIDQIRVYNVKGVKCIGGVKDSVDIDGLAL